jgi:plastocyanin
MRRLVLVIAAAMGIALASAAPASAADASVGTVDPFSWDPPNVTINPGEQVTWTNTSGGFHTLRIDGQEHGTPNTAWTYSQSFAQPGTYSFVCGIHLSAMSGTVTVNPVVYTWQGTTGAAWDDPANWTSAPSEPGTYPGGFSPSDVVVIDNGTQPQLDVDLTIGDLQISGAGSGRGGAGALTVTKTATATGEFAGTGKTTFKAANLTVTGLLVEGDATARFEGNTHLTGTVTLADTATIETAGTLHGEGGGVAGGAGTVINTGTVDPGGTLTIHAAYEQTGGGTLAVDVGSSGAERLVTNGATLNGTLVVHTAGGFQPTAGDTFNVLTATSVTGQFATFSADQPGGITYKPNYSSTGVTLSVEAAAVQQTQNPSPTTTESPPPFSTPAPTPVATATTSKVAIAKLAALPRKCGRGHSLRFKLKKPAGAISARVLVNGKRRGSRSGKTFTSPITLKKLPKRFTLTVQTTLVNGDKLVATKRFSRC